MPGAAGDNDGPRAKRSRPSDSPPMAQLSCPTTCVGECDDHKLELAAASNDEPSLPADCGPSVLGVGVAVPYDSDLGHWTLRMIRRLVEVVDPQKPQNTASAAASSCSALKPAPIASDNDIAAVACPPHWTVSAALAAVRAAAEAPGGCGAGGPGGGWLLSWWPVGIPVLALTTGRGSLLLVARSRFAEMPPVIALVHYPCPVVSSSVPPDAPTPAPGTLSHLTLITGVLVADAPSRGATGDVRKRLLMTDAVAYGGVNMAHKPSPKRLGVLKQWVGKGFASTAGDAAARARASSSGFHGAVFRGPVTLSQPTFEQLMHETVPTLPHGVAGIAFIRAGEPLSLQFDAIQADFTTLRLPSSFVVPVPPKQRVASLQPVGASTANERQFFDSTDAASTVFSMLNITATIANRSSSFISAVAGSSPSPAAASTSTSAQQTTEIAQVEVDEAASIDAAAEEEDKMDGASTFQLTRLVAALAAPGPIAPTTKPATMQSTPRSQQRAGVRLAIIVPFRDEPAQNRGEQLKRFAAELPAYLRSSAATPPLGSLHIIVVEQSNDGFKFNRGKSLNVGMAIALDVSAGGSAGQIAATRYGIPHTAIPFDAFCLHDVDLLPAGPRIGAWYCRPPTPRPLHLGAAWSRYSYERYVGGILTLSPSAAIAVNGFPNNYWGWGGEDDEMAFRLDRAGLMPPERPVGADAEGTLKDLEDILIAERGGERAGTGIARGGREEWRNMLKRELYAAAQTTWRSNGLNSLRWSLLAVRRLNDDVTVITVDLHGRDDPAALAQRVSGPVTGTPAATR